MEALTAQPRLKLKPQLRTSSQLKRGPVRIQIEGFRPIFNEGVFVDMKPENGNFEPLIGYIVLEQSQASVDMPGHRLVPGKHIDLKSIVQNYLASRPISIEVSARVRLSNSVLW